MTNNEIVDDSESLGSVSSEESSESVDDESTSESVNDESTSENLDDFIVDSESNNKKRKRDTIKDTRKYSLRKKRRIDYDEDLSFHEYGPINDLAISIANNINTRRSNTTKVIAEYKPLYEKIQKEIINRTITENSILESTMSFRDKVGMMELLQVLHNAEPDTEEWLHLKIRLYEKIKQANPLTEEDYEIANKLKAINNNELSIEKRILRSPHPKKIKAIIYKKYEEIKYLDKGDESYYKLLE